MSPIIASDIEFRLSGGAANVSPAAALGGAMSTAGGGLIVTATLNNLFDDVSGAEGTAGDIEYRGVYVRNKHATLTLVGAKLWIVSDADSPDDTTAIALGDEGNGGTLEVIANENTAPVGPAFSAPGTKGAGLNLGDLDAGEFFGFWVRRTIVAGADAQDEVEFVLRVEGETAA